MSVRQLFVGALFRRLLYGAAIVLAAVLMLWVAWRRGRAAGLAAYAIKRAEARVKILQHAAEVRRNVEANDHGTVSDKLSGWMRDEDGG
jgi:ABC-type transport system involved in cytochrome bd biosynthesis fused ATPase/permease subunit